MMKTTMKTDSFRSGVSQSVIPGVFTRLARGLMSVVIAASLMVIAPDSMAKSKKKPPNTDEGWSEWAALGEGYMGRRKEPKKKAKGSKAGNAYANYKSPVLWLYTGAEGLYSASVADLAAEMGVSENDVRKKAKKGQLALINVGNAVSWYFDSSTDTILFVGETYDTFYTDQNAYRFASRKGKTAKRMKTKKGAPNGGGDATAPFAETLKFEEEPPFFFPLYSVGAEPDVDFWFWDFIMGFSKPFLDVPLNLPNPAATGPAQLHVTFRGFTDLYSGDEHQVQLELNGQPIGSPLVWDGFNGAGVTADFDTGLLNADGNNTLRINSIFSGTETPGQFLDDIVVDYLRNSVALDGQLWMHDIGKGNHTVTGFNDEDILVFESPDGKTALLKDVTVEPDGAGGYKVTFKAKKGGYDYLVVERGNAASPDVAVDIPSNLTSRRNTAEYLIIAPREFAGTANALAAYRSGRFSSVGIAWADDIFDVFSHGLVDPYAYPRFMNYVQDVWATPPSVVMILGKGTIDLKNRMGMDDNYIPTLMTANPYALTVSDDRLLGGTDGNAPFSIGRLPMESEAEGQAYLAKLIAHEAKIPGADRFKAALIADPADPDAGDFPANSELLACRLTGNPDCGAGLGFTDVTKYYEPFIPFADIHDELIKSSSFEKGFMSYDGHGSAFGLGSSNYLSPAEAGALANNELPIFSALTCAAGNFAFPGVRSVIGSMVLNPNGGAVSAMTPSGLSLDGPAQALGNTFVDSLYGSNNTIGDAVKDAKQLSGVEAFMRSQYMVIGAPAVFGR